MIASLAFGAFFALEAAVGVHWWAPAQSISFANSMIRLNNWFLKNGQAPITIDDIKIKKTISNLTAYHKNRGYFRVEVSSNKKLLNNKKGEVDYIINTGRPTYLDSIRTKIKSPVLDSLYQSKKALSYLKSGDQFIESNFIKEAKRITNLFRNNGIYHFTENDLGYYNIDTANTNNYKTNIDLVIFDKKRILKTNGDYILKPYTIQKIRKVTVFTDYSFSQKENPNLDSISYKGINFLAHNKIKYNPKLLSWHCLTPLELISKETNKEVASIDDFFIGPRTWEQSQLK